MIKIGIHFHCKNHKFQVFVSTKSTYVLYVNICTTQNIVFANIFMKIYSKKWKKVVDKVFTPVYNVSTKHEEVRYAFHR